MPLASHRAKLATLQTTMNLTVTADRRISIPLDDVVGSYRTFGTIGPTYVVLGVVEPASGGNVTLEVRVSESGEVLQYPLARALENLSNPKLIPAQRHHCTIAD